MRPHRDLLSLLNSQQKLAFRGLWHPFGFLESPHCCMIRCSVYKIRLYTALYEVEVAHLGGRCNKGSDVLFLVLH